jgi:hypothetical protein
MHAIILSNRQLRATNRSNRHRAASVAVHLDWFGKILLTSLLPHVKNITAALFAFVINQMHGPARINGDLRLDPAVWGSYNGNFSREGCGEHDRQYRSGRAKRILNAHAQSLMLGAIFPSCMLTAQRGDESIHFRSLFPSLLRARKAQSPFFKTDE